MAMAEKGVTRYLGIYKEAGIEDVELQSKLDVMLNKYAPDADDETILRIIMKNVVPNRFLTEDEIDDIVKDIPTYPATFQEIRAFNKEEIRKTISAQLRKLRVNPRPQALKKLKEHIITNFMRSVIDAGESVGFNSAMAVGQPLTQLNLNSFHKSGSTNTVTADIKMVQDLLYSKSGKNATDVTIFFENKNLTYTEAFDMINYIRGVNIKDLLIRKETLDTVPLKDMWWYRLHESVSPMQNISPRFIRLYIDPAKMYKYSLTLSDISKAIHINNVFSPTYMGIIDIHPSADHLESVIANYKGKVGKKKHPIPDLTAEENLSLFINNVFSDLMSDMYITGVDGVSEGVVKMYRVDSILKEEKNRDDTGSYRISFNALKKHIEGIPDNKIENLIRSCRLEIVDKTQYYFDVLQKEIETTDDKGEKTIKMMTPLSVIRNETGYAISEVEQELKERLDNEDYSDPTYSDIYRYGTYTYAKIKGQNIVRELMDHEEIDRRRVIPENVNQVAQYYGISAARMYLLNSYTRILEINPINMELIVDFQTVLGFPVALNSIGSSRQRNSTLQKIAFQDPMKYLTASSSMGVKEDIKRFSECIMTGKTVKNGTGIVKLRDESHEKDKYFDMTGTVIQPTYGEDVTEFNAIQSMNQELRIEIRSIDPPDFIKSMFGEKKVKDYTVSRPNIRRVIK